MPDEPLIVERTFDAPVETVWKAITEVDQVRLWFFDLKEFRPEAGFEFEFTVEHDGFTFRHLCKVIEAIAQKKLAYTWRYAGHPGDSLVTFELFAEGRRTRATLTHTGLETFPKLPAFARKNFLGVWTELIGVSLSDYVATADREVVSSRLFAAPRELVFGAFLDAESLKQWWGPKGFTNTFHAFDPRPGGQWRFTMHGPDGNHYENESVFVEIVKPERIVFDHGKPMHHFRMNMTFTEEVGQTRLTWRMRFTTAEECARVKSFVAAANQENFNKLAAQLLKLRSQE